MTKDFRQGLGWWVTVRIALDHKVRVGLKPHLVRPGNGVLDPLETTARTHSTPTSSMRLELTPMISLGQRCVDKTGIPSEKRDVSWNHGQDVNLPVIHDYTEEDIANPEEVILRAYDKLEGPGRDLKVVIDQLTAEIYRGSSYDLVDAVTLTIQVAEDAVDSMQSIDDTVEKWERMKSARILSWLS